MGNLLTPEVLPPTPRLRGLFSIFGSTFLELTGVFMLAPWLLLQLKGVEVSTAHSGLFAATGWLGIFVMTPFASAITQRLGRRPTLWLSGAVPVLAACIYGFTHALPAWFAAQLLAGTASGLRWVLAEAVVAEFSPEHQRGRNVGLFETMVGATFVLGPLVLVWVGPHSPHALWVAMGCMALGLLWSGLIPPLPPAHDAADAKVGLHGVWHALRAHPVIMLAGFTGGFFESGLTSILPLYGWALGLGAAAAALLVSASGLGSSAVMLPVGALSDWLSRPRPGRPAAPPGQARLRLMRVLAGVTLLGTLCLPWAMGHPWLAWPMAFVWGGAGGSLYTLSMIDIGSREKGVTLVNSTAVLVMSYTLGGVLAPSLGGAALQWSATVGFPLLLTCVAGLGWWMLLRARVGHGV